MVVYPALREANMAVDADPLKHDHGQIKTFIYELKKMRAERARLAREGSRLPRPCLRRRADGGRAVVPSFKEEMTEEQNDKVTNMVNPDGFWMA